MFVDRYGRRRRAVIGTGVVLAVALTAWLGVMLVAFAVAITQPVPAPAVEVDSVH